MTSPTRAGRVTAALSSPMNDVRASASRAISVVARSDGWSGRKCLRLSVSSRHGASKATSAAVGASSSCNSATASTRPSSSFKPVTSTMRIRGTKMSFHALTTSPSGTPRRSAISGRWRSVSSKTSDVAQRTTPVEKLVAGTGGTEQGGAPAPHDRVLDVAPEHVRINHHRQRDEPEPRAGTGRCSRCAHATRVEAWARNVERAKVTCRDLRRLACRQRGRRAAFDAASSGCALACSSYLSPGRRR